MDSVEHSGFSNLELDVSTLPRYEEVDLRRLSKKYLYKLQIGTGITFVVFMLGLFLAYYFLNDLRQYILPIIIFFFVIFGWSFYSNFQLAKRNGYAVRERDIIYRRGFLFERITVVPFNRVQHVSVERSVLDKILKLSTLKIFTAGGSGSDVNIPGLLPTTATSLKEEISERASRHV